MSRLDAVIRRFAVATLLLIAAGPAAAQSYRLVPGDMVEVSYIGTVERFPARVDVDGQVRLPDVGGVKVAELTLDEAEEKIEAAIRENSLFKESNATVVLSEYAPIVMAGDVAKPGRYDYLPLMTVGTALGLAGGSQITGINQLDIMRAQTDLEAQIRIRNLEIAGVVVRIARWEAILAGAEQPELTDSLKAMIPDLAAAPIDALMAREREIFANGRKRTEELLAFWEQEISTIEAQRELFAQRIRVQEEIVANTEEELARSEQLLEQGLQSVRVVSGAEQRYSDARGRLLEMESAQVSASGAIGDAQRERTRYLTEERGIALQSLQDDRQKLDTLLVDYGRAVEQLVNIADGNIASLASSDVMDVEFTIISPRPGRPGDEKITTDTVLLPGDTLVVDVKTASSGSGG